MTRLAAALLLLATAAAADPKPNAVPPDWAPSTGKEMPKAARTALDPATLGKQLVAGMKLARGAKTPAACNRVVGLVYPAAVGLHLAPSKKTAPVFEVLARCARLAKRYQVLEVVARTTAATELGRSSDLATALIGQDRKAEAAKELATRLAATPDDPFLLVAQSRLACSERAFEPCRAAATKALASKRTDPELASAKGLAHLSIWYASFMLGDYPAARAAAAKMPVAAARDALTKLIVPAERTKLSVDVEAVDTLALGVYHLAGSVNPAPFEVTVGNADKRDRELRIEIEVPGVTSKTVKNVVVLGKRVEHLVVTPPLLASFLPANMRAPRKAEVAVRVSEGDKLVVERTIPVTLLPRDYLPTWQKTSADTKRSTLHNIAAWVTPNDPAIEQFLTAAKKRLIGRQSFAGPQQETLPQVQAIFDELKARGVTYVMDPAVSSDQFLGQRTRLPAEVLASTNAQCLEGTLLFAALLEAIGLDPVVVTVPGHAFIGWHASPKDGPARPLHFVETTMVGTGAFENAVAVATKRVATETEHGTFKTGASKLLEIKALRGQGITPQH